MSQECLPFFVTSSTDINLITVTKRKATLFVLLSWHTWRKIGVCVCVYDTFVTVKNRISIKLYANEWAFHLHTITSHVPNAENVYQIPYVNDFEWLNIDCSTFKMCRQKCWFWLELAVVVIVIFIFLCVCFRRNLTQHIKQKVSLVHTYFYIQPDALNNISHSSPFFPLKVLTIFAFSSFFSVSLHRL